MEHVCVRIEERMSECVSIMCELATGIEGQVFSSTPKSHISGFKIQIPNKDFRNYNVNTKRPPFQEINDLNMVEP